MASALPPLSGTAPSSSGAGAAGAASGSGSASASPPAAPLAPRQAAVNCAGLDLLQLEFGAYLLRNHDDGRVAQEQLFAKLEAAHFAVGRRFAERLARDRERLVEVLDVVKFLCREFWTEAFRKPVDKLQTNNKGTFVLQDFSFRPLRALSTAPGSDARLQALRIAVGACGLVRGALAAFGLEAAVNADVSALPRVVFQIRL